MGEHREFVASFESMGEGVWSVDDQIANVSNEVVRCRDCKHYSNCEWILATDVMHVCHFWHGEPTKVEPNGYCAWGVRRDEA